MRLGRLQPPRGDRRRGMTAPSSDATTVATYTPDSDRAALSGRGEAWRGHLVPLDGLRGLAILLVLLLHFTHDMYFPDGTLAARVRSTFGFGWIGVDLFFVLSGFLITGILADNKGSDRYF